MESCWKIRNRILTDSDYHLKQFSDSGCFGDIGGNGLPYLTGRLAATLVAQIIKSLPARTPGFSPLRSENPLEKVIGYPLLVFLSGEYHGERSLVRYSPCGCKELGRTNTHTHTPPHPTHLSGYVRKVLLYSKWEKTVDGKGVNGGTEMKFRICYRVS